MRQAISAIVLGLAVSGSQAGIIVDGTPTILPALVGDDYGHSAVGGLLAGADLSLDREFDVTFTALFQESDYRNYFVSIGNTLFDDIDIGGSFTTRLAPGVIPFRFGSVNTGVEAINGSNAVNHAAGSAQFLVADVGDIGWIVGFNDSYTGDFDFDDMVVGVRIDEVEQPIEVPEPGSMALLALGLAGLGASRLGRREQAM